LSQISSKRPAVTSTVGAPLRRAGAFIVSVAVAVDGGLGEYNFGAG